MPSIATVDTFMAAVEAGDYVGAIERFYTADARTRENLGAPRVGRDTVVMAEKGMMAAFDQIKAQRQGPPLITGDHVAIRWRFEFISTRGPARVLEEVAWQTWNGEEIVEETFFYDPAQMAG